MDNQVSQVPVIVDLELRAKKDGEDERKKAGTSAGKYKQIESFVYFHT